MPKIFMSYRREDCSGDAGRLYDRLSRSFDREQIFYDIDSLKMGTIYGRDIKDWVSSCDVLLVLIGNQWLTLQDDQGCRRLDDPEDWVRVEIQTALEHDILIIPTLLQRADMPNMTMLPDALRSLANYQAWEISQRHFHDDVSLLVDRLRELEGEPDQFKGMVLIPKGVFLFGEQKVTVTIEDTYLIGKYPVTTEQYGQFMVAGGYRTREYWSVEGWKWMERWDIECPEYFKDPKWKKPGHPIVGVSYYEAEAYARWAGKRLATEQEWEKAARGTDGRVYPWGEEFKTAICNSQESREMGTSPVWQYVNGASPYECNDMAGNVWEWTASLDEKEKKYRVIRGGSWNDDSRNVTTTARFGFLPTDRSSDIGFRCAKHYS